MRAWIAAALSAALAVPLTSLVAPESAVAADGQGAGQSVSVAVQADGFSLAGVKKVNIVSSSKFKGAVRIERDNGKYCLATKGGANDGKEHGAQWTGCNGDASKAWIVEPLSTLGTAEDDDTEASNNETSGNLAFVLRSWKYPKHCYFSQGNGFDGAKPAGGGREIGVTPHCDAASVTKNPATHFGVKNDPSGKATWEYLRGKMVEGAIAFSNRSVSNTFAGNNLWVRPMSMAGDYVGDLSQAASGGYFVPHAIKIAEGKESAILGQSNVSKGCVDNRWWWGLNNTQGLAPLRQRVVTAAQVTDGFTWGMHTEIGVESGSPGAKVSLKSGISFETSTTESKTESREIEMEAPAGFWAQAVVTTPAINVNGAWKSGTAFDRVWSFGGAIAISEKQSPGTSVSSVAVVNSHEQKSCAATAATTLVPGAPFRVQVPGKQIAPRVGDTVTADVSYVQPAHGAPLDVRYQWFADDEEIPGQTGRTLEVTADYLGAKLRFSAYENGGPDRFESPTKMSLNTAAVVVDGTASLESAVTLPQAMLGETYEIDLLDIDALDDNVVSVTGDLPAGLAFHDDSDALVGAPTELGSFEIVVQDEDGNGPVTATLEVVPEAVRYPGVSAIVTQVNAQQDIRLAENVGAGAGFDVQFFSGGEQTGAPAGMGVVYREGIPYLVGTPTAAGTHTVRVAEIVRLGRSVTAPSYEFTFDVRALGDVLPPDGEPVELPDITLERITDPADGATVRVGQDTLWAVRGSDADEISASVHRAGESTPVPWATVERTLVDELEIDGVPTEPGDYVITVSASNGAGSVATTFAFTVTPAHNGGNGGNSGGGAGEGGAGGGGSEVPANPTGGAKNVLSATGGDAPLAPLALGAGALLLGALVVAISRLRRTRQRG